MKEVLTDNLITDPEMVGFFAFHLKWKVRAREKTLGGENGERKMNTCSTGVACKRVHQEVDP